MSNTAKLTGSNIHDTFCSLMECEKKENVEIKEYDDMEYFHVLKQEAINNDDIVSQYKEYDDGKIIVFVNVDILNQQPYHSVDILLAQLFDIYSDTFEYYIPSYMEATRLWFIKSAPRGYDYWYQFSSSYMSFMLFERIFENVEKDEEYSNASLKEKYTKILSEVHMSDADNDVKLSTIMYLLGRLAYLEDIPASVTTIMQLNKQELTDFSEVIDGNIGIIINNTYKVLIKSVIASLKIQDFMKLDRLIKKMIDLFTKAPLGEE